MKLIINADDAGIDGARNQGIMETVDFGLVKSISVIVGQLGWQDILDKVKGKNISIGFHFNLTAGKPLSQRLKTLVDKEGRFFNKVDLFQKANKGGISTKEALQELTAQFQCLKKTGITPTHIDGHNHVHILPGVREVLKMGVPGNIWVRLPLERDGEAINPGNLNPYLIHNQTDVFIKVLRYYALGAKQLWKHYFRFTHDFSGTKITNNVTLSAFKQAVNNLKGHICELMCHPGSGVQEDTVHFSRLKERELEKQILTSNEFKEFLNERGIEVVSFKDV